MFNLPGGIIRGKEGGTDPSPVEWVSRGQDQEGRVRHQSQGRAMNTNLRGQGRGGSQKQGQQGEIKGNMKGMRGFRGRLVPAVNSNYGLL